MHQSDFHRKKNFANPNHLFHSSVAAEKENMKMPAQANRGEGESQKTDEQKSAAVAAAASSAVAVNSDNVEEVRTEHLLKHPLQNTWTLWYLDYDRSKTWEEMLNDITSFDTVEDFWSIYNHIKSPSEIKSGCDYSLFKKGIRPMWEDEANKKGGRWMITLTKVSKSDLDNLWLDVLLCLIGEAFDNSDQICGAVVNIRPKSYKIAIWTADGNNPEYIMEIGTKLRDALRLGRGMLNYQLHTDTMVKTGSSVKSIYTL